ncbi:MAG: T9SS type A sorting domain-containing protein [Chitinophagales bacterium]|nr:T9SS type A sorting domain-containing protein [Chitinophagales bacterium]
MSKIYTLIVALILSSISVLNAQIPVNSLGSVYSQNFNTLADTGTANVFNILGWLINTDSYRASDGGANNGSVYSFGLKGSEERSLGSINSNNVKEIYFGANFKNESSEVLNEFNVQFKGEQWRRGDKKNSASVPLADTLVFQYSLNATSINDNAATWVNVPTLNFISPVVSSEVQILDGNLAHNSKDISGKFNVTLELGGQIYFRWANVRSTSGISGSRDGLSVDDVRIAFNYDSTWVDNGNNGPCTYDVEEFVDILGGEYDTASFYIEFSEIEGASGYIILLDDIDSPDYEYGFLEDGEHYSVGEYIEQSLVVGIVEEPYFEYNGLAAEHNYEVYIQPFYECEGSIFYGDFNGIGFSTIAPNPCDSPEDYAVEEYEFEVNATSVEMTFSAVEDAVAYLVIQDEGYRNNPDYDWGDPIDGEEYTAGEMIGQTKVVYVGASNIVTIDNLSPDTYYLFSVFPIFDCDGETVYGDYNGDEVRTKIEGCDFDLLEAVEITNFYNNQDSFHLEFDLLDDASSYLVTLDKVDSDEYEFGVPESLVNYQVGDNISDSKVIAIIRNGTFDYSGLEKEFLYYVNVYPIYYCNDNPYYGDESFYGFNTISPPTPCDSPDDFSVDSIVIVPSSNSAILSYPPLEGAIGYIVFLDVNYDSSDYNWGWPELGESYQAGGSIGDSKIVYVGPNTSIEVVGLEPETRYLLSVHPIFSCDSVLTYGWYYSDEFVTNYPTGIKNQTLSKVLVYPNPISGNVLKFQLNESVYGKANVQIFNAVGALVYSLEQTISSNMSIALPAQLAAGRYSLRIEQEGKNSIAPFVIVK